MAYPPPPPGGQPYQPYGHDPFNDNNQFRQNHADPYQPSYAPPDSMMNNPAQQGHHSSYSYNEPSMQPSPSPGIGDSFAPQPSLSRYDNSQRYPSPDPYQMHGYGAPPVTTNAPSAGPVTGVYLPDPRMTSPPPLVHHSTSQQSGLTLDGQAQGYYPPPNRPYSPYGNPPNDGRATPGADLADEPLLHRQPSGDGRYGTPFGGYPSMDGSGAVNPDEPVTMRYGPAPDRVLRRLKTTKRVQLFRGNLVLECPVPSALLDLCPIAHRKEQEFSLMRYTAVTSQPDDFMAEQYTLRQKQLYEPTRKTEIFIVITMYNEDDVLFARTMRGVMANIAHLNERERSPIWKDEGWKKVVVCVVVDGRKIFNPRTRAMLAALGVYQEGVAKNVVNGKPVTAHVYEYTTQLYINSKYQVVPGKKWAPVQMILCVKENNAKKINSHRWFFNAFGPILQPNVCVLLDVGTDPAPTSIYHLWKTFDLKPNCGGACGEIVALKGKYWKNLLNPLVAAQNFEYKLSNILDKPLESAFGQD